MFFSKWQSIPAVLVSATSLLFVLLLTMRTQKIIVGFSKHSYFS